MSEQIDAIEFQTTDQETAFAHAAMLREIATGRYKPKKPDECQRRFDALLRFILTGKCDVDEQTEAVIKRLNQELKKLPLAA